MKICLKNKISNGKIYDMMNILNGHVDLLKQVEKFYKFKNVISKILVEGSFDSVRYHIKNIKNMDILSREGSRSKGIWIVNFAINISG